MGLAGTVRDDAHGLVAGTRVVAFSKRQEAWAEVVSVPRAQVAVLPEAVDFTIAACVPVAGLTALHVIEKAGPLLGRRVFISGATGGVGRFAVQLAALAGATVVAPVRREEQVEGVLGLGAAEVPVAQRAADLDIQTLDVVIDGLGGEWLPRVMGMLTADGITVSYAATTGYEMTLNVATLFGKGRSRLHGYNLYDHSARWPVGPNSDRVLALVVAQRLVVEVARSFGFDETPRAADVLLAGNVNGKVVVNLR